MSRIQLGSEVSSSDGQKIGKVDKIVVDPPSRSLVALIVQENWEHTSDRILDMEQVDHVDEHGHVHTSITLAQAKHLKTFVKQTFATPQAGMPSGPGLFHMEFSHNLEVKSSIDSELMVIEHGRDVVDGELEKLGELDEVSYDDNDVITGIVVRTGLIRHREVPIPIEDIGGVGARYVRVKLSKDEFEKRKSQS
jgi:uncharacterized protein YrrD